MDIKDILKYIETVASQEEIKQIRLICNRAVRCEWSIYYLPNARREGYLNSKGEQQVGKVGMTSKQIERRLKENAMDFDITDWKVLERIEGTRQDALNLERKWQVELDCLDNCNQSTNMRKKKPCKFCSKEISVFSLSRHEKSCSTKLLQKKFIRSVNIINKTQCKFCSKETTANNIASHERACKKNPNRAVKSFPKPNCTVCGKPVSIFAIARHQKKCESGVRATT